MTLRKQDKIDKTLQKTLEKFGESGRCRVIGLIIDNWDDGSQILLQALAIVGSEQLSGDGQHHHDHNTEWKITHLHINDHRISLQRLILKAEIRLPLSTSRRVVFTLEI